MEYYRRCVVEAPFPSYCGCRTPGCRTNTAWLRRKVVEMQRLSRVTGCLLSHKSPSRVSITRQPVSSANSKPPPQSSRTTFISRFHPNKRAYNVQSVCPKRNSPCNPPPRGRREMVKRRHDAHFKQALNVLGLSLSQRHVDLFDVRFESIGALVLSQVTNM
jgi:hypothetical protein